MKPTIYHERLLLFDLDDTLFKTRSIGVEHLEGIFSQFRRLAASDYSEDSLDAIEKDLWSLPFDQVATQHQFSTDLRMLWSTLINETKFTFNIRPFPDFEYIKAISCRKVLVTTGFKHLQEAKITALGIASEFEDVHIDEIDNENRIYKSGIFKKIVSESGLNPKDHIVIGDNPESELKAGSELGLMTVQMAKFGQPTSQYSDHYIRGFEELVTILNDAERRSF